ncbi:RNA exonuclease 1 [Bulinus truncatus]|nr:RNA exonuclease 1 [Bulinus truncatus]
MDTFIKTVNKNEKMFKNIACQDGDVYILPGFLDNVCHSRITSRKNGPSYSSSGTRPYQQNSTYNQGLHQQSSVYNQQSTFLQPDVARYSTMAPTEPTGPVETYKTLSLSGGDSHSIPTFTSCDKSLPESLEDPLNLASLPKISGLPKPKPSYSNALPSYVPTPKTLFQPAANLSAPAYNPTPKSAPDKKPSRTIEYDPVKNFSFVEKMATSSEDSGSEMEGEERAGDKNHTLSNQPNSSQAHPQPDTEFSDHGSIQEAMKPKQSWEDDLTDSDEDVSCRNISACVSVEDKLKGLTSLLLPSSQITGKLVVISGDSSPKKNGKIQTSMIATNKDKSSNKCFKNPDSSGSKSKPHQLSSTNKDSLKKVSVHRSHSSNSEASKSQSKKHSSKTRSLSESRSLSTDAPSKSSGDASPTSAKSISKTSNPKDSLSKKAVANGSESSPNPDSLSSKRSFLSKSSSNPSDKCSSKSSHSSSKDKKESSSSKQKPSSKETSQKLSKHTERAGSSTSEKENRRGSKSKPSDDSQRKASLKQSSSTSSLKNLSHEQEDSKQDTQEKTIKIEKHDSRRTSCEEATSSSKSKSSSSKSKVSRRSNSTDTIVKKERGRSCEDVNQTHSKDRSKNGTKHKNSTKESAKQSNSNISIKEEKLDKYSVHNKDEPDSTSAFTSKHSNGIVKLEKPNSISNLQGGVLSVTTAKSSDFKKDQHSRHPSVKSATGASLAGQESDGYDSDVQIVEVAETLPQIYQLSSSEDDNEQDPDKCFSFSDEVDMLSDSDTFDECLRIFQESEQQRKDKAKMAILNPDNSKEQKLRKPVNAPAQMRPKMSPAEVMHNRIVEMQKRALLRAAAREGRESELPMSLSSKTSKLSGNKPQSATNIVPIQLSTSADSLMASSKRREAHAPKPVAPVKVATSPASNHTHPPNTFYSKHKKTETAVSENKSVTIAGTASKTEKRKAHEPTMTNLKRPVIPAIFGDKVPSNIRQRYLNLIIDEYLKFNSEEVAFQKEEEQVIYTRASNKNIYLGLTANTIKKIRMEAAECQPSSSKKPCLGLASLSSLALQPSHMSQSHAATLGGSHAAKTSFTLHRSGAAGKNIPTVFTGKEFYERLKKYILTDEQLKENGYPRPSLDGSNKVVFYKEGAKDTFLKENERTCRRCGKRYYVNKDGSPATIEKCIYHHGSAYKTRVAGSIDSRYACCSERAGTKGCQVAECHVNERNKTDNLTGYMKTLPSPDKDFKVYSLDCEMVYTKAGLELARVTVVGEDCNTVYETLVRPDTDIIDYNTRFSGITEADMKGVTTNLRGVQAVMLSMFSDKTILMGHSLESDLVAMKLIHSTVVDTSLVFPHRLGLPYKRALRNLMVEILQKIIQDDVSGHDSKEDAAACMQLMHHKVKEDAKREVRRC